MVWSLPKGSIFGDIGESAGDAFGGLGGLFSDIGDAFGDGFSGIGDALGGVGDGIGDVLGGAINLAEDGLDAAGDVMGDAVDAVGDVMNAAGDVAEDAVDAAGDLAADIGDGIGDGLDAAGDLTGGVVDAVGGAFDAGEELAGDGLDAARDLGGDAVDAVGDAVEDAVGGDDDKGGADDVDMYAGAGPMDLDDEGPTGSGSFAKVSGVYFPIYEQAAAVQFLRVKCFHDQKHASFLCYKCAFRDRVSYSRSASSILMDSACRALSRVLRRTRVNKQRFPSESYILTPTLVKSAARPTQSKQATYEEAEGLIQW